MDREKRYKLTRFENPHSFYLVPLQHDSYIRKIEQQLKSTNKASVTHPIQNQEYLALDIDGNFKRVQILSVEKEGYYCWLMDYGEKNFQNKFYTQSKDYLFEPLSLHAGLNNVVGLEMIDNESGIPVYKSTPNFSIGSIKLMTRYIKEAKSVIFQEENNYNNVHFGQLFLDTGCDEPYNLIQALEKNKVISIDKEMFERVIGSKLFFLNDEDIVDFGIGRGNVRKANFEISNTSVGCKTEYVKNWINENEAVFSNTSQSGNEYTTSISMDKIKYILEGRGRGLKKCTATKVGREYKCLYQSPISNLVDEILPNSSENSILSSTKDKTDELMESPSEDSIQSESVVESKDIRASEKKTLKVTPGRVLDLKLNENSVDVEIPTHSRNNVKGNNLLGCNCKNCKFWNISGLETPNKEVFKVKKLREKMKPPLFFKSPEDNVYKLNICKMAGLSITNKAVDSNTLVHGTAIPSMQKTRKEVPFNPKIHEAMKSLNYIEAKSVQAYGWPTVMRNMNLCIVSGSGSGKSMTYVPAVCSFLLEKEERYINLPITNSPIVIVLSFSSKIAEDMYSLFMTLLNKIKSNKFIKMILAVPPLNGKLMEHLNSNCDILIATPSTLITLLAKNVINLKRLCHIIIESADKILDENEKEMHKILSLVHEMLGHRNCINPVQLICNSERWTLKLENLLKMLKSTPVVIIGNHLQSSLYGRADIKLLDISSIAKPRKLYDILKEYYDIHKSIVICNQEDVDNIKQILQSCGIRLVIADNTMSGQDIYDAQKAWMQSTNGEHIVMLCTDQVMKSHLKISNASLLVHYSMANTWTTFTKRFSCLINSYKSPLIPSKDGFNCKVYIFIDNDKMAPRLADFLKSIGSVLPETLAKSCQDFMEKEEENRLKLGINLCEILKTNGICNSYKCPYRHTLSISLDQNTHLPNQGMIKYKILEMRDVNRFVVKLMECIDYDGKVVIIPDKTEHILNYLEESKCLEYARNFEINKFYVFECNNQNERCKLRRIVDFNSVTKLPLNVEIEGLDNSYVKIIPAVKLFEMPDGIKAIPPTCIEIYIANLVPKNNETLWTQRQKNVLIESLTASGYKDPDVFCTSKILLILQNTIWVDNQHLQVFLPELNESVNKFNLKKFLIKMDLAVERNCLNNLYNLCRKYDIVVPNYDITKPKKEVVEELITPQWAYLSEDTYNPVYFSSGDPSRFYVRLIKFDDLLLNLQNLIQKVVLEPFYKTLDTNKISVGKYYLAKDKQCCEYCRVIIINIENNIAECFFVDYGDTDFFELSELKSLRNDLITKLPFQAIECRLYGVKPIQDIWQKEAVDVLYKYCFEPNSEYFRELFVYIFPNSENGFLKHNTKYSVALVDYTTDSPKIINKIIYRCGFALEQLNESLSFDLPEKTSKDSNNSGENEVIKEKTMNEIYIDPSSFDFNLEDFNDIDDNWDLEIFDQQAFINECSLKVSNQSGNKLYAIEGQKEDSSEGYHPIKTSIAPKANIYTPSIQWYQTNTDIKIEIKLIDVANYNIKLNLENMLCFDTNHNNKNYEFSYQLYSDVLPNVIHSNMGQCIRVNLKKAKEENWERLVLSKEIMKNIKYNLDKTVILDEECQKERKFLEIGEDMDDDCVEGMYVHDIPSDIDYSDSDIEDYEEDEF